MTSSRWSVDQMSEPGSEEPTWDQVVPVEIGDPGRAAKLVKAAPVADHWDRRDTVLDGVVINDQARRPALELRAASVRGLSHRHYGRVRQDEYAYRRTNDGQFLVAVVADGVSAGELSHLAAARATRYGAARLASEVVRTGLDGISWDEVVRDVALSVERHGREQLRRRNREGVDHLDTYGVARHLATTALFVVVDLQSDASGLAAVVLPVGDTSAWVLRSGATWEPLQAVKNAGAAIASAAVTALPAVAGHAGTPTFTRVRSGDALVLMTDGVGDPLGDGTGDVGQFLASVWSSPPTDLQFAAQVGFARKSFDDDRTAVALWPLDRS